MTKTHTFLRMLLNQCLNKNAWKIFISLVLCTVLQSIVFSILISPALLLFMSGQNSGFLAIFALLGLFFAFVCGFMLFYGLETICSRMILRKYATIGYLFIAFSRFDRRVFRASCIFSALSILILFSASIFVIIFSDDFQKSLILASVISTIILILLYVPFSFVFPLLHYYSDLSLSDSFKKSAKITFSHFFEYVSFLFLAGGIDLITFLLTILAISVIPETGENFVSAIQTLLSFFGFYVQFKMLTRISVSFPLYCYYIEEIVKIHGSDFNLPALEDSKSDEHSL